MKCIKCKKETDKPGVRCPDCARTHREYSLERYYVRRYGAVPEKNGITKGYRPNLRDQILNLLADGVSRKTTEIQEALNWNTTTSIPKTLGDIKKYLEKTNDSRKLEKVRPSASCRDGAEWKLINKNEP